MLAYIKRGLTPMQLCEATEMSWGSGLKQRLDRLCREHGVTLADGRGLGSHTANEVQAEQRITEYMRAEGRKQLNISNGKVLIGSDAHYWPGIRSTAHRAFVKFAAEIKPCAVIMNGDGFDGASISRHPRIGWDKKPSVIEELKAVEERLTEIEQASRTKNLFWPLGNHDARYETFLAANAAQYEGVKGFHLKDHFPLWAPCWSVWINEDVVIKHRLRSGIHATHNNTVNSGKTIVTGHLHSLRVTPFSDYGGTRFGVDCGTLAAPYGPQFVDYLEDGVTNWRAGFCVLTFWKGTLLWPELVHVLDEDKGLVQWRGEVMKV